MTQPTLRLFAGALLLSLEAVAFAASKPAPAAQPTNDFPTVDRVLYVQECMRAHPGPGFEMTSKCSCTLDKLAASVKFQDYVTMSTIVKAMSIGGERGGAIRDVPSYEPEVKRYKDLVSKAEKACFIGMEPR
ncbi:hypothetical protein [Variovorax sp. OV329]|uniref:hypothetical protein n=1 Tax=Variovorax sp. OV329 TaxID=1882825 RepID=UPI0008E78535|nr:hypothetical protein [Variovorax sp. OV329]SFL95928.1 hypothetical protein SAMN05444747_101463 [Variovorax sp. OV329]